MPPAIGKGCTVVTNSGANAMRVFGSNSDTINGEATATGVSVAAGEAGQWCSPASTRWLGGTLTGEVIALTQGTPVYLDASRNMWVKEDTNGNAVIGAGTTRLFSVAANGNVTMAGSLTFNGAP